MSEVEEKKKFGFLNKIPWLKKIKHLDIILTVLFVAIILLIYFSSFGNETKEKEQSDTSTKTTQQTSEKTNTTSLSDYSKEIETKIENIVSQIKNTGNVSVAVNFLGDIEYKIAYTEKKETNENGSIIETKSPVLVEGDDNKSSPIILQTIMPEVSSIVIVASGAKDTNVKLEILRAVQTLFEGKKPKIEIFAGN